MKRSKPKIITDYTDRHGRRRWRFRTEGVAVELGTEPGSAEFERRLAEAWEKVRNKSARGAGADRTAPGSLSDLLARFYRSPEWRDLGETTKRQRIRIFEALRNKHGHKPVALMERRHVMDILAAKADTPSASNNLRKRLAQLMDFAIALDWRKDNPVRAVKPYTESGKGFHTWDEGEIARFLEVHPAGTTAHLAMTLMLYTAASRGDAARLGWGNVKDGRIRYRRGKMLRRQGKLVDIPMHRVLADLLASLPRDAFTFLQTAPGAGRTPGGLGNAMRRWCDAAGLPECTSHGLRKACSRRLAEAGCTANEIMAITGHKTLAEVTCHTDAADRAGLADAAMNKLQGEHSGGATLANHPARFAKKSPKPMKGKGKS